MRLIQILEALDYGDGVSGNVIYLKKLLDELKVDNIIYTKFYNEKVSVYRNDLEEYKNREDDIILFHFSGQSSIIEWVAKFSNRKIICYQNVTPAEFFAKTDINMYHKCKSGIKQFENNQAKFDRVLATSQFNKYNAMDMGVEEDKIDLFPNIMPLEESMTYKRVDSIIQSYKDKRMILSVARIAPNKKIEDIIKIFSFYYSYFDQDSVLILIGEYNEKDMYYKRLMTELSLYKCKDNVVFTGKISDEEVYTYYQEADYYICMSEHEGFCMPLIEAMYYQIPVIGYNACAVPYTMDGAGVLCNKKDIPVIAKLMELIGFDCELKDQIINKQNHNVSKYKKDALKKQLNELIEQWKNINR